MFEQSIMLKDESNLALLDWQARRIRAAKDNPAAVRGFEPGDDTKQRRLSRARRAKQSQEFARADIEADITKDIRVLKAFADMIDCNFRRAGFINVRQRQALRCNAM